MYNPSPLPGSTNDTQEFEYIELKNIGNVNIDLSGVRFINGIDFDFTGSQITNLEPGQVVLVVKNRTAFEERYGSGLNIAGEYSGRLDNAGERIQLVDATGEEILDFDYNDNWHEITDGLGFSIVIANENADSDLWRDKSNWRVSSVINGTPGGIDTNFLDIPPVIINEILAHSISPLTDFIELYNTSTNPADISGWFLTDDFNTPYKYRIPDNTVIPSGGYVLFDETNFNPTPGIPPSFALSADGDDVYLFSAKTDGTLTGYVDGYNFGPSEQNRSLGTQFTTDNRKLLVSQKEITPGTNNVGCLVGPIVITEIMYHPPDIGTNDNSLDEYIEIMNISSDPVLLFEPTLPTNTWQLRGGVDMVLPTNITLQPNQYMLFVNFDPTNTVLLNNFASKYIIPDGTIIVGPYQGKLNNANDDVELEKPTLYSTNILYVQVDKVDYFDDAPWQKAADGFGFSLNRISPNAFGNDPSSWVAALPNPGMPFATAGTPPSIISQSESRVVSAGQTIMLTAVASGTTPIRYKWLRNEVELTGETNSILVIPNVQPENTGEYIILAENEVGAVISAPINLLVTLPPIIIEQPESVLIRVRPDPSALSSTNATFSVSAIGNGSLTYQWRFNGANIIGATNNSITITNVQMSDWGEFTVIISDDTGSAISQPAWLYPLVRPSFTQNPIPLTVCVGGTATLSAEFFGWPPPFTTEWRRVSTILVANVQYESNTFFSFQAPLTPSTNNYRCVVKNAASSGGVASGLIRVAAIADTDSDGIPDIWETTYGFKQDDPSDRDSDADGDGMSNIEEYIAGTNPTDPENFFTITSIEINTNSTTIKFNSVSNRTYTVEFTTNIGDNWIKLFDLCAKATNKIETIIDSSENSENKYYRVRTPRRE